MSGPWESRNPETGYLGGIRCFKNNEESKPLWLSVPSSVSPPGRGNTFARASVPFTRPAVTRGLNFTAVQFQIVLMFPSCSAILLEFVFHQL